MNIVRFSPRHGPARYGVLDDGRIREIDGPFEKISFTGASHALDDVRLLAPCEPSKIVCGGMNYHGHIEEMNLPVPDEPMFFLKPPSALIGPDDNIVYPPETRRLEYEGELAVVVGRRMRRVEPPEVADCLLGYTAATDMAARDINLLGGNFLHLCRAKGFDTFCPVGPTIQTEGDFNSVAIKLSVDGETRQDSRSDDMIFSVERMVSFYSQVMTLLPGDLILTGSPPGTGPVSPGNTIELWIEGVGTLRNRVVAGP
jgi:2-keto-4-pentenoate hydratase/2-oxohepta-3-ene-1,7-dioic acid hydratase in catechol pathway